MEEGFYHENPSIAASKIFPPKWHYKPWNLAKPQSYYATILEITDSVKFKHFKLHSDHTASWMVFPDGSRMGVWSSYVWKEFRICR